MDVRNAIKNELLQVALHEDCSIDLKYAAARELQRVRKVGNAI
ncbi:hypothetical protein [Paenibacillus sp. FSL W8-1287]